MDSVEEDEEGNKSSPPETVTEPGSTLACSAATGPGGKTSGSKRKTEVGPTSPKPKKKKTKRCPSLGTTFKQAEDDVLLVQEQPYKIFSRIQISEVQQQLLLKLEEKAEADEDAPLFDESGIRHSRFHLSCSDAESYTWTWLKQTVDSMKIHGDNQDEKLCLQLVPPAEVPKLLRAEVYISGPPRKVPRFIRLFKVQNKLMHTDRWVLRHQQQTEKGQLMVCGID